MNQSIFTPGTALQATSSLELSISCRDLLDSDMFSRSDPMCVVYHQQFGIPRWVELLRTEIIWDCLNPDFVTKVGIDYHFEQEQLLRFEIYDVDAPTSLLQDHDYLGFAECSLGQIVSAGYHALTLPLSQSKSNYRESTIGHNRRVCKGSISILAEELIGMKDEAVISIEGHNMGSSLFYCLCVPRIFFTLFKINESGNYTIVYRSETYPGENPIWKPLTLSMARLCNGDKDRVLKFQCFRDGISGYHTELGTCETTFNKIAKSVSLSESVFLSGPNLGTNSAFLVFRACKLVPTPTFVEFIRSGTQIHCSFAIDFTSSNGDPSSPNSLHYFAQTADASNPYEQAIRSVGDIIKDYDPSQSFPVYGFGARIPPTGIISHHFPANFNPSPVCQGIPNVLNAYRDCIRKIQLAGPTNFAPIIRDVAKLAEASRDDQHYYVLLMITDGIINDMPLTKEAIVNASGLPLSIVIVGVGGANFDNMDELDGDTVRLSSNGRFAQRDIVQFIPYRDEYTWLSEICPQMDKTGQPLIGMEHITNWAHLAKARLAQEVLAEIPGQLTSYMKTRGIAPPLLHGLF